MTWSVNQGCRLARLVYAWCGSFGSGVANVKAAHKCNIRQVYT
jgi:hypothetical protein